MVFMRFVKSIAMPVLAPFGKLTSAGQRQHYILALQYGVRSSEAIGSASGR